MCLIQFREINLLHSTQPLRQRLASDFSLSFVYTFCSSFLIDFLGVLLVSSVDLLKIGVSFHLLDLSSFPPPLVFSSLLPPSLFSHRFLFFDSILGFEYALPL